MDPTFVQNLHNLLQQTTAPDTAIIKAATASLNRDYYKNPLCIPALFEIIATSPAFNIRQLAAVELRKRTAPTSSLWESVPQDARQTIKRRIVEVMFAEENKLVRHATARVVAAIAEIELPLGQWDDLIPTLLQSAMANVVVQREIGSFTLSTIITKIGTELQAQLPDFFKLFSNLAHDNDSLEVRVTSVRALGTLAEFIDVDEKVAIRQYQEILPSMIAVLGQVMEAGDEKAAREIFDVFDTLLILEAPLLSKHITPLVQFLIQYSGNRSVSDDIRSMALNGLNWTVKYKRSKVQSQQLSGAILEGLFPIAAEPMPEDPDDESPSRTALRVIDVLAVTLPASQVFPPMRALVQQYMSSGDPSHRRAALMVLGTCVEGIAVYLTQQTEEVWQVVDRGLADPEAEVRKAACTAIGCLCEHCEEECSARHAILIPAILELLNMPETQMEACIALDAMLEIMPSDVEQQYLNPIMERLVALLDRVPLKMQPFVIGAIGSAAHSAKEQFTPYFPGTVAKVQQFLALGDSVEEVELKGVIMDSLGTFAQAVGRDVFRPYFADLMKQAFAYLSSNNPRLSECSFVTFDVLSDVFGEEFAPYLSSVVPAIIKSLQQSEHGIDEEKLLNGDKSDLGIGDFSTIVKSVQDDGTGEVEVDVIEELFNASSSIVIEKQNAASAVGTIFVATKRHFLPYVEEVTLELLNQIQHYSEPMRKSAFDSLFSIIQVFYQLSEPQQWEPGLPPNVPLHDKVRDLVNHILPRIVDAFAEDDEKSSVSSLLVGLAETINEVGPAFVENHLNEIFEMVSTVLQQKAVCQMDPDQEDEEEELEDQSEEDSMLISSASDVVAALATALGPQFAEPLQTFFPLVAKYFGKNRSGSDRSSTIGCIGEIIGGMKGAITPYTEHILELLLPALSDTDPQVQSNGAYAAGMLVENSDVDLSPQYLPLLAALRPLFEVPEGALSARFIARDNACGAVSRMILKKTESVPLEQVLPILVSALPLKNDYLENRPLFRAIFHLVRFHPAALAPYIEQLLAVFNYVLNPDGPDQLGDETRQGVLELVAHLNAQAPEKIQAAGVAIYLPTT